MKENVYLIDLGTGTDRSLLPLACGLISSYCETESDIRDNYNIHIRMLGQGLDEIMDEIKEPAVVGFSCYCWNFLGSVDISKRLKEKYPYVLIVWGGPSIPAKPHRVEQFLVDHPYVDILVHLEGEITFAEILLRRIRHEPLCVCPGISYRVGKEFFLHSHDRNLTSLLSIYGGYESFIMTEERERMREFDNLPSPFLNGTFDKLLDRYGDHIVGALWETNRGCPFKCSFCDWGNALVNKVNRFSVERVLKEIEWVSNKKLHYVYATDANFGITVERDLSIAKGFVDISKKNGLPDTLILNWTKNSSKNIVQIADTLWSGGIITNVTLSYQSFHQPTLDAIKRDNIKPDYLDELKAEFHAKGVPTYNELILGLPEETLETFVDGIEKACSTHVKDQLSIYLCCILENTELRESIDTYGIQIRKCAVGLNRRKFKYPRFGEDQIVVGTNTMPTDDWQRAYEIAFAFTCFYNLRVAYFIILYLKHVLKLKVTDFIKFILDTSGGYQSIRKAIAHLRDTRQLILDSKASVKTVAGGDGVALTPHEAMTFLLFDNMGQTYSELKDVVINFCTKKNVHIDVDILDDIIKYQKTRIPVFDNAETVFSFDTNMPMFFEELSLRRKQIGVTKAPTELEIVPKPHPYSTETEFNLRRVACGYTLNLVDTKLPMVRNTNLAGKF